MKFLVIGAVGGYDKNEGDSSWVSPFVVGTCDSLEDCYKEAEHSLREIAMEYAYDIHGEDESQQYWESVEEYKEDAAKTIVKDLEIGDKKVILTNSYNDNSINESCTFAIIRKE